MRIHQKNLQVLATEIFKVKVNISPEILKKLFSFNLRNKFCVLWQRKPLFMIRDLVPDSFKNENSLERFKNRIKTSTTDKCPCRICKVYIGQVGFI